jgi:hypothetical protein
MFLSHNSSILPTESVGDDNGTPKGCSDFFGCADRFLSVCRKGKPVSFGGAYFGSFFRAIAERIPSVVVSCAEKPVFSLYLEQFPAVCRFSYRRYTFSAYLS